MSWTSELYKIYMHHKDDQDFLPLYHIQVQAAIEVTLDENSQFVTAELVEKKQAVTLAPVTEDSATRSNSPSPMPFTEKLSYIAGDYCQYVNDKKAEQKFELYREQMERWMGSDFCHPAVRIVYQYVIQKSLIHDLVQRQIFQTDDKTGKLKVEDVFVRFRINYTDKSKTAKTWEDKELQDCFIAFNRQAGGKRELCYASGEIVPITYKHPAKILNAGDKAKLISANDDTGFAYRGRFSSKEEAFSVGYEYSNQIHNALSWLVQNRCVRFGSLYLIIWESEDQPLPDIRKPAIDIEDEYDGDDADASASQGAYSNFKSNLCQMIEGYRQKFDYDAKVMLMGLDETTPGKGRISMSLYTEIAGSRYLENIQYWHETTVAERWYSTKKKSVFNTFSLFEIINAAFGHEEGEKLACKPEVLNNIILRLVPCVTERRKIPSDIVHQLCAKASRPLSYNKKYNHRLVLEVACGMIRKRNIENHEGVVAVSYDPNETDRSYLYGCLLALANKTEAGTYNDEEDRKKRSTNAQRYWEVFSKRPCQTWKIIEERLQPYLNKPGSNKVFYEKCLNEIMDKMTMEMFSDDSALSPAYLLGYHHYTSYLYNNKKNNTEEEA
ncbi:type I-C CRISPR-associated protein Cas8c/Csd1 [Ruminococcus sp.]|uniref:type I-C CRISPR-associated protein Cas8c/Csd1 n=1 Tax=Ruminococcus sp. TaxID=41978 RepID=UPI0025DA6BE7|nr:type I-C CRISPR-associated protein Cas8c/Csd1 [Ruminococcus sp.]